MRIKSLKYWKEDLGLLRPYMITYVRHESVQNIFIQIDCEDGVIGLGAGSPSKYVTGEIVDDNFEAKQQDLSSLIVGRDLREFQSIIYELRLKYPKQPALLAALDMALYDAFCHAIKIPLLKYLGQKIKPIGTSVTIGIKSVEEVVEEGLEYAGRGFKFIKLKIGLSLEEDIERFIKLREAMGSEIRIRVDANQGFSPEGFSRFRDKTRTHDVEFYEQPFKPGNKQMMLDLDSEVRNICAADEDLHNMRDAMNLSEGCAYGIYNIKIMKCGGITESRRIGDVASNHGIKLMWGCMDESRISISASLNAAMSCPTTAYLDLDGSLDLARDIVTGGFEIKDGVMYPLSDAYGLGVSLIN